MPSDRPISFRPQRSVAAEIDRRTTKTVDDGDREYGRADAIRGALGRYYEICRRHFTSLGLSRSELAVMCTVLNGGMLGRRGADDNRLIGISAEIADVFQQRPGYGRDHGISDEQGRELAAKIQQFSYADLVALVDFVERFWANDPEAQRVIHPEEI